MQPCIGKEMDLLLFIIRRRFHKLENKQMQIEKSYNVCVKDTNENLKKNKESWLNKLV